MISWCRNVVRSFGNLFAAMLRDPVWAIIAIVTAPFRAWKHIVMVLVVTLGTGFVAGLLTMWIEHIASPHARNLLLENSLAVVSLIITLAVFLRLAVTPLIQHFGYNNGMSDTHGSARFGNKAEAMPLVRAKSGLLIGRGGDLGLLRYDGPAHLLTMAPTRTGKGVGTIIPNLLTQSRSIICIDPKGENAKITARARRMFGQVHILDPFGITGMTSAAFNPLDALDPHSMDIAEDAATWRMLWSMTNPDNPAMPTGMTRRKPSSAESSSISPL